MNFIENAPTSAKQIADLREAFAELDQSLSMENT